MEAVSLKAGFSLLELVAVLAILALLGSLALTASRGMRERQMLAQARSELAALVQALEAYRRHFGDYPRTGAQPSAAVDPATGELREEHAQAWLHRALSGRCGPTLQPTETAPFAEVSVFRSEAVSAAATAPRALLDPWGRRYRYQYRSAVAPAADEWNAPGYVLFSAGPDGALAGEFPADGLLSSEYAARLDAHGRPANADNLYAHRP